MLLEAPASGPSVTVVVSGGSLFIAKCEQIGKLNFISLEDIVYFCLFKQKILKFWKAYDVQDSYSSMMMDTSKGSAV